MAYTEKDFERFQRNELRKSDTFCFDCTMCGNCCRRRQEPILITGADIFRMAKALNTPVEDVVLKNTRGYIGDSSHCPVVVLTERLDGSCRLLRKGHCMVHQNKPTACALFPLGRYFDIRDNTYHYFLNDLSCNGGTRSGKEWTLQEWLDEFHIEESEEMSAAWHKLFYGICGVTLKMNKKEIRGMMLDVMLDALYFKYDFSLPYIEQVEAHMGKVQSIFRNEFHKDIKF